MNSISNYEGVALITGAGSEAGIGFAVAQLLSKSCNQIALVSTTRRIEERAAEIAELGVECVGYVADLVNPAEVERCISAVRRDLGAISVLVNNAGMGSVGKPEEFIPLHKMSDEQWNRSIQLNLTSAFLVTRSTLPDMFQAGFGRIVNVSSITGVVQANLDESGYAAGKAGMVGMTKALALEVAAHGITVNAVAPGWISTAAQNEDEARHGAASPMGRSGRPEEVAYAIEFLCSKQASYVNGHVLVVDGGNCLVEGLAGR